MANGIDALELQKRKHKHIIQELENINPVLCPEPAVVRSLASGMSSLLEMDVIRIERKQVEYENTASVGRNILTRLVSRGIEIALAALLAATGLYFFR